MRDLWPFSFRKRIPEIQWKYTNTNLFIHDWVSPMDWAGLVAIALLIF